MFVRRLKIILGLVILMSLVLLLRIGQVQIIDHDFWSASAAESMNTWTPIDAPRGKIQDIKGRDLAFEVACLDVAVDYRAIIKDPAWIETQAKSRLARNPQYTAEHNRKTRQAMLAAEVARIGEQIDAMWVDLAKMSGKSTDEIAEIRQTILRRVELRHRLAWYNLYRKAAADRKEAARGAASWYEWLLGSSKDDAPDSESYHVTVGDELSAHAILRDISSDDCAELTKNLDQYPGLEIRESAHRHYAEPANTCACFLLGRLSLVTREDLETDPNRNDDLQKYMPNDLIGRDGIEKLADSMLRGTRGRMVRKTRQSEPVELIKPIPGQDVRTTIDIDLQSDIMGILQKCMVRQDTGQLAERTDLHGAVVLIDVPTGEVRAMVSNPGFDLNRWDADYATLAANEIDKPTLDRATMAQHEPGSTVKPIIGSTAVTLGVMKDTDTVECNGYLVIDGRKYTTGRCWTASMFEAKYPNNFKHHGIPTDAPHPTGFLTLSDALQRSCNVYFETVAHRMGIVQVAAALHNFGLGQPTGVGIAEAAGHVPNPAKVPPGKLFMTTCLAGIGQDQVFATPIQMANVAATLARGGIWVRPHLLLAGPQGIAERRDLGLSPEALAAVKQGMMLVVNSEAGTGTECRFAHTGLTIAGKTGSAQAGKFSIILRDANGRPIHRPDGTIARRVFEPGELPWYQGTHLSHAWYMGYAPANNPKIAFAVMIEYGGSGGLEAGSVARETLEACIRHGYLAKEVKDTERGGLYVN